MPNIILPMKLFVRFLADHYHVAIAYSANKIIWLLFCTKCIPFLTLTEMNHFKSILNDKSKNRNLSKIRT